MESTKTSEERTDMKSALALALLVLSLPAAAVMGVLVSSTTVSVGGSMYWSCTYAVGSDRINQLIPLANGPCPPTINL